MTTKNTFTQRTKVGRAGLLTNQLMGNNSSVPIVGKGATILHYSDRSCAEVVEVSKDGRTVKLQSLNAVADKSKECGMGHQNWILIPEEHFYELTYRNGAWRRKHTQVLWEDTFFKNDNYPTKQQYAEAAGENGELKIIKGLTKLKTSWNKISIIFGIKDYRHDWEF